MAGGSSADDEASTPGDEIADQERLYWDNRRRIQEQDDDETGRRERQRLRKQERKVHSRFRDHRHARREDPGPVRRDMKLPPLPDPDDLDDEAVDFDDRWYGRD